jgi:paraquat-inducible protein A
MRLALPVLFIAAPVLFAFGIMLPLVRFEKLYFFEDNPALTGIISSLWTSGDHALAVLVALFSIVFPFVKMVAIAAEALSPAGANKRWFARLVPFLSKWSMMDVMLVAVVIAAAKTSGLANAFTEAGLWCYAGSALIMSAVQWMVGRKRVV